MNEKLKKWFGVCGNMLYHPHGYVKSDTSTSSWLAYFSTKIRTDKQLVRLRSSSTTKANEHNIICPFNPYKNQSADKLQLYWRLYVLDYFFGWAE